MLINESGAVSTACTENLKIAGRGTQNKYGPVQLVSNIERNLFKIGQLTQNREVSFKFKDT